jgi:GntR family transcriptional regulator
VTGLSGPPNETTTAKREPAYVHIERHLWGLLAEGGGVSAPLPGEVQLAQQFGVSVMTVRQAYNQLVNAGAVVRVRSQGTFAVPHVTDDLGRMTGRSYPDEWRKQASDVASEVLQYAVREAPKHIATRFQCAEGAPLTYLERLRFANDQPVAWDTRWMPVEMYEAVDRNVLETSSVFSAMGRLGFVPTLMQSDISARQADPIHTKILNCPPDSALLVRALSCTDADGTVILVGTSIYPAARFSFRSTTPLTELHLEEPPSGSLD